MPNKKDGLKKNDLVKYKRADFELTIKIIRKLFDRQYEGIVMAHVNGIWPNGHIVNFTYDTTYVTVLPQPKMESLTTKTPTGRTIELNIKRIENA